MVRVAVEVVMFEAVRVTVGAGGVGVADASVLKVPSVMRTPRAQLEAL